MFSVRPKEGFAGNVNIKDLMMNTYLLMLKDFNYGVL